MDIHVSPERIGRRLQESGVSLTPQRIEVAMILLARPQHLSAEQIIDTLRLRGSRVSKATVYNTLNLFVERQLVQPIHVDTSRVYYDSTTAPHHHFYNVDTGKLSDIPAEDINLEGLPALPPNTVADGVQVVVRVRNRS